MPKAALVALIILVIIILILTVIFIAGFRFNQNVKREVRMPIQQRLP